MKTIPAADQARLLALQNAPLNKWIALSADETRIIAVGETFAEVTAAAEEAGEDDPLFMRVPEDWSPRIL